MQPETTDLFDNLLFDTEDRDVDVLSVIREDLETLEDRESPFRSYLCGENILREYERSRSW